MVPAPEPTRPGLRVAGGVELVARLANPPGGEGWLARQQHAHVRADLFPADPGVAAELGARAKATRLLRHDALSYTFDVFRDAHHCVVVSPAPRGATLASLAGTPNACTVGDWLGAMRGLAAGLEVLHAARLHHGFVSEEWIHVELGSRSRNLTLGGVGLCPSPHDLDAAQTRDVRALAGVLASAFHGWTSDQRRSLGAVRTATALHNTLARFQREAGDVRRGFRMRLAVVVSLVMSGLVLGVAATHRTTSVSKAAPQRPPPTTPVQASYWGDDFAHGLERWLVFGEPRPRVADDAVDADAVLDCGGGILPSGALSRVLLEGPDGWELRHRVLVRGDRRGGCTVVLSLTVLPAQTLPHAAGWLPEPLAVFRIGLVGADSARPDQAAACGIRCSALVRNAEGALVPAGDDVVLDPSWANRWATATIQIDRDGGFRCRIDGTTVAELAGPVDPRLFGPIHIALDARSGDTGGRARVDAVEWEPLGRGWVHTRAGLPDAAAPVAVPWTRRAWRAVGCELPERAGRRLSLETEVGEAVRIESVETFVGEPHFLLELMPFLQSGDHDSLTILLREAERGHRAGLRLAAGVVTLVEERADGALGDAATLGTYTPGVQLSLHLRVNADGELEALGSRLPGLSLAFARNGRVPVVPEIELHNSTDGVVFDTLRVATRLSGPAW